jgi:hypothetical protein
MQISQNENDNDSNTKENEHETKRKVEEEKKIWNHGLFYSLRVNLHAINKSTFFFH